jgi:hypothetical protein
VIFVGEMNPYGGDPKFALYPMPPGSAGAGWLGFSDWSTASIFVTFDTTSASDTGTARELPPGRWS